MIGFNLGHLWLVLATILMVSCVLYPPKEERSYNRSTCLVLNVTIGGCMITMGVISFHALTLILGGLR